MDASYSGPEINAFYISRAGWHASRITNAQTKEFTVGKLASESFSFLQQSLSHFLEQLHLVKQKERTDFQERIEVVKKEFSANFEIMKSLSETFVSFCREILESMDLEGDTIIRLKAIQNLAKILDGIARSNHFEDFGVVKKILLVIEKHLFWLKSKIHESAQEQINGLICILKESVATFCALEINRKVFQDIKEAIYETISVTTQEDENTEWILIASDKPGIEKSKNQFLKFEKRPTLMHVYLDFLLEKTLPEFSVEDFPLLVDLALTSDFQRNRSLSNLCESQICRIFSEQKNTIDTALTLIHYLDEIIHNKRLTALAPRFCLRAIKLSLLLKTDCQNALKLEIQKNPKNVREKLLCDCLVLTYLEVDPTSWQRIMQASSRVIGVLNPAILWNKKQESLSFVMHKHLEKFSENFSSLTFGQMCCFYSNLMSFFCTFHGMSTPTFLPLERLERQLRLSILKLTTTGSILENITEEMVLSLKTVSHFLNPDSQLIGELGSKLKSPSERCKELEKAIDGAKTSTEVSQAFATYLSLFNPAPKDDFHFSLLSTLSRIIETDPLIKENIKELYKLISDLGKIEFGAEDFIQTADKVIVPFCFCQSHFVASRYAKRAFPLAKPCAIAYKLSLKKNEEGSYVPPFKFLFYSQNNQELENLLSRLLNAMWQMMNDELTLALNDGHADLFVEDVAQQADVLRTLIAPSIVFNITNLKNLRDALKEESLFTTYISSVHTSAFLHLSK